LLTPTYKFQFLVCTVKNDTNFDIILQNLFHVAMYMWDVYAIKLKLISE
jgi:hypothetical protein